MEKEKYKTLTQKQNICLERYFRNGRLKREAYCLAYNTENMSKETLAVEVCKFFKNPNITLRIKEYDEELRQDLTSKINYAKIDSFNALCTAQEEALAKKKVVKGRWGCTRTENDPDISAFNKAEELKIKLVGLINDNKPLEVGINLFGAQLEQKAAGLQ